MTRDEIADGLMELVLEIANTVGDAGDDPLHIARRAYIRGIGSHAILQLRDRVLELPAGASLLDISKAGK
jgi:hypothetical protein